MREFTEPTMLNSFPCVPLQPYLQEQGRKTESMYFNVSPSN